LAPDEQAGYHAELQTRFGAFVRQRQADTSTAARLPEPAGSARKD
jgi:hypothetical protein